MSRGLTPGRNASSQNRYRDTIAVMEKKTWKDLSYLNDAQIIEYFITQGKTPAHAKNSMRFVRTQYGVDGIGGKRSEGAPKSDTSPRAPKAPRASTGTDPLSSALLETFKPTIADMIEDAMADYVPATSAVREVLVCVDGDITTEVTGMYHEAAEKVLKLCTVKQNGRRENVMMVGPAGCGKTSIAKTVATALNLELTVTACSAGMSEATFFGRLLPLGEGGTMRYVPSSAINVFENGGVWLIDEIDSADSNLMLAINAMIENGFVFVEGRAANGLSTRVDRHPDCIILAAANTWGHGADAQYVGRNALDAATLDRFYRVFVTYSARIEDSMGTPAAVAKIQTIRLKAFELKIKRVVSSRAIRRLMTAIHAGFTMDEALRDEFAPWSADERTKIGLAA